MFNQAFKTLRNKVYLKIIKDKSRGCIYALKMGGFLRSKFEGRHCLHSAARAFQEEYDKLVEKHDLVVDLQSVGERGHEVQYKNQLGEVFWGESFSTNSYNDLDKVQECRERLSEYVATGNLSSCLSRKIAGRYPVHVEFEEELKSFLRCESVLVATSGYVAQMAAMTGLFGKGDVIFSDQLNHSSIIDGIKLSGAKVIIYPHLDYSRLEYLMAKYRQRYNHCGIVSDGVFSAQGTAANLYEIHRLKAKYDAVSVIDDTHGFAVLGESGRGIVDHAQHMPDILTASLAKGLAGFGGVIAGSSALIKIIDCFGRQNINTSHLSPILAAQGLYQLKYYRKNKRELQSQLFNKVRFFNSQLEHRYLNPYKSLGFLHPIFSFTHDDGRVVIDTVKELFDAGIIPAVFPPPVAPTPTIRFSLHRHVSYERLAQAAEILYRRGLRPVRRPSENPSESINEIEFRKVM